MKNILLLSLFLLPFIAGAQIFYNGDFEINDGCPPSLGQVSMVDGWFIVVESADFYACDFTTEFFPTDGEAACGDAYMGFASYGNADGSAEAIGSQLPAPLVPGETYDFTIQLKMPTGGGYSTVCGGLCVYGFMEEPPLNVVASHPSLMAGSTELFCTETVDNTEWEPYAVTFTADQAYEYLVFSPGYFPNCAQNIFMDCIEIVESESFDESVTICAGEEVILDPGFGPNATWSTVNDDNTTTVFATTDIYTFNPPESVTILVEAPNDDTYTYDVNVNPIPEPDLGEDILVCEDVDVILDAGANWDEIAWNGEVGAEFFTVLETGTVEVSVTLAGCVGTDEVDVSFEANPDFSSLVTLGPACEGLCNGQVELTVEDNWTFTVDGEPSNGLTTGLCEGLHTFDIVSDLGCVASDSELFTVQPAPAISVEPLITICEGSTVTLEATSTDDDLTFTWSTLEEAQAIDVTPVAGDQFCVSAVDPDGCPSAEVCTEIAVHDPLVLTGPDNEDVCPGDLVSFLANAEGGDGNYTWQWTSSTGNVGTDAQLQFNASESDTYTVLLSDGCTPDGISTEVELLVAVIPTPELTLEYESPCLPSVAAFSLTDEAAFQTITWAFGDETVGSGAETVHTYETPGCFDVDVALISNEGCLINLNYEDLLCAYELPLAGFDIAEGTIVYDETERLHMLNSSEGAETYQWFLDEEPISEEVNPIIEGVSLPGFYDICLEVANPQGCIDQFCREVEVILAPEVYIPNAFTPDLDGINEVFKPAMAFTPVEYEFYVFDRWGDQLFSTTDPNQGWIGNNKAGGYYVSPGIYLYKVVVKMPDTGNNEEFEGHVVLIR
ncbi:MAG: gliding motility-associated C-terminal domain-containing protein [Flavobacteriales bacterium]|nr:gliding motility-associated C-terminal domain-containing protein [Flavobacteriales bacterium]